MDWESAWNVTHFELWEKRGAKWSRAITRYYQAGCVRLADLLSGRWLPLPPRKEQTRMSTAEAPAVTPASLPALGRAILARMDAEARQALVAAIREELAQEVQAQALVDARSTLEEEFHRRRIRLQDDVAKATAQAESDAEARIDSAVAKGLDAARAELEETVVELREERDQARQAQDAVTDLLLDLVRQVVGTRKTYLFSKGITQFDQHKTNLILRAHGIRIRSESLPQSERQVQTILTADTVAPRALFWTEAVKGAADEDEPMIDGIPAKYIVRP